MKITRIETLSLGEFPNLVWVLVHTDSGAVGLGETFFGTEAVASYVHETLAPQMLGQDPLRIEAHSRKLLQHYVGFKSTGTEIRGASAFDLALWDIFGQVSGQPLYQLLGGKCRERIRVYNTCAGYRYVRKRPVLSTENWGLSQAEGPYEDLDAFLTRADELAESLLSEGYTGMKIWPFDFAAEATNGTDISTSDLKKALEPFEKIRKRVGNRIDVHVELHALWQLPAAIKIARALEPFDPYWYEDPIKMSNMDALARFRESTRVWTTASETLSTRWAFRELFERGATSVAMLDIGWCGGMSEAKKIATMAEAYELPLAPHDCTGPALLTASVHLAMASPNALVQEVVRAFYHGWYRELVTDLPPMKDGFIAPTETPGLGTALKPELRARADARLRASAL
ncbi:MAG: mandelate racemase/muconate lactonizing enzyme family protein [Alphaproteobacteria bacterium]